jgi:hypothetical protein
MGFPALVARLYELLGYGDYTAFDQDVDNFGERR